ncbi:MAG TPA: sugar ABC transporter ATP-binding protein [Lacipirellulaceae bacterium]|nr:sugar ABC transporter ATP-binding protein [Lacipirellulaceae bacterium]HMP07340.1 sugar ABC transporter ATP-binding protein [Lacipirellulaceae bacterium]
MDQIPVQHAPDRPPLLSASGICKSFPGVRALDNVQIIVHGGRLNAVLGENGAGKSTLMNILAGVLAPDAGELRLEGRLVAFRNPRDAQRAGVAMIHQELNLLPELSVAENIYLGREPRTRLGLIDFAALHRNTKRLLEQLELDVPPATPLGRLRIGAQQVVEIAKALAQDARVLILDEPTSAITEHEVSVLFRLIAQLKSRGVGLIYITHKLDELPHIADDVTVLRDGEFVAGRRYEDVERPELVRLMVGRDLSEMYARSPAPVGDEILAVERLSLRRHAGSGNLALSDVTLRVRRGEIVGLFGLMGAGRTELLQCLFGIHADRTTGTVRLAGRSVSLTGPQEAIAAGIALAPEDRKAEGLVLPLGVTPNTTLASLRAVMRGMFISRRREQAMARTFAIRLGIKTPSLDQPVRLLSGGNQQKVVLAKWLATKPRLLLLDEPTRGIDLAAKREIYALIDELARQGLGVLMASSEMPELLGLADRIVVLCEGRVTGEFPRESATEESLLKAALPTLPLERLTA